MSAIYAYKDFYGRRADGTIIRGIIPQFDGSTFAGTNCGPASEAMRVVSQQQGKRPSKGSPWYPTGASIRRETGDTSGGTNPSQTTRASFNEYGVPFAAPRIRAWRDVTDRLDSGYAVDLLVGYGPIDDYLSGSPGFRGNHRIVLVGYNKLSSGLKLLSADPLYDGRRSNIPLGAKWIPQSVLVKAAGALRTDGVHTLNSTHGNGMAYFIPSLTRLVVDTKDYRVVVPATTFWVYSVVSGVITGRRAAKTGGFSARCTDPTQYRWPGKGTYTLVRITSGAHAGKYIAARYAEEIA